MRAIYWIGQTMQSEAVGNFISFLPNLRTKLSLSPPLPIHITQHQYHFLSISLPIHVTSYPCQFLFMSLPIHITSCPYHFLSISLPINVTSHPCHFLSISLPIHITSYPCHFLSISLPIHITSHPYHLCERMSLFNEIRYLLKTNQCLSLSFKRHLYSRQVIILLFSPLFYQ